jgi:AcrR family transcriptional regulator
LNAVRGCTREEILQTAARLFASSGFRTSLADIADACGILPGSLYHHFDSKEAIVVELVHRCHVDLDRIAKEALDTLHEPGPRPVEEKILDFGRAIAACGVEHRAALLLTLYLPPMLAGDELAGLTARLRTTISRPARVASLACSSEAHGWVTPGTVSHRLMTSPLIGPRSRRKSPTRYQSPSSTRSPKRARSSGSRFSVVAY